MKTEYRFSKSSSVDLFLRGSILISVLDGDTSCIQVLSNPTSEPTLLFKKVTWVLKIPLEYPESNISCCKSTI